MAGAGVFDIDIDDGDGGAVAAGGLGVGGGAMGGRPGLGMSHPSDDDIDDPEHCLKLFRAHNRAGLMLLVGLLADLVI